MLRLPLAPAGMIDPITGGAELRAYAEGQGIDYDALLAAAARHFESPTIRRRTTPFTPAELAAMYEEDNAALGS